MTPTTNERCKDGSNVWKRSKFAFDKLKGGQSLSCASGATSVYSYTSETSHGRLSSSKGVHEFPLPLLQASKMVGLSSVAFSIFYISSLESWSGANS